MPDIDELLARDGLLTRRDTVAAGLAREALDAAERAGKVVRLRHGLYCRSDLEFHGLLDLAVVAKVSGGVIWGASAGKHHDLTDDIPFSIHVLVPPTATRLAEKLDPLDVTARRTRDPRNLSLGVEAAGADGLRFRVTDRARTVVDLVRLGGVRQHAVEAVRAYVAGGHPVVELQQMAEAFGVFDEVSAMAEAVSAAFERMPSP